MWWSLLPCCPEATPLLALACPAAPRLGWIHRIDRASTTSFGLPCTASVLPSVGPCLVGYVDEEAKKPRRSCRSGCGPSLPPRRRAGVGFPSGSADRTFRSRRRRRLRRVLRRRLGGTVATPRRRRRSAGIQVDRQPWPSVWWPCSPLCWRPGSCGGHGRSPPAPIRPAWSRWLPRRLRWPMAASQRIPRRDRGIPRIMTLLRPPAPRRTNLSSR